MIAKTEFDANLDEARKTVAAMDKIDGFKPRDPKTIWSALEAGLRRPETNCAFEALVMLEDVVKERKTR